MAKAYFAVLAIGRDSPGIVAAITGVLSEKHSCNIETSQMMILGGHFSIALIASKEAPIDTDQLAAELAEPGAYTGVRHVYVNPIDPEDFRPFGGPESSHMITVETHDRAGLLYQLARTLADNSVNITYLGSDCSEQVDSRCSVAVDITLPSGMQEADLRNVIHEALPKDVEIEIERPRRQS